MSGGQVVSLSLAALTPPKRAVQAALYTPSLPSLYSSRVEVGSFLTLAALTPPKKGGSVRSYALYAPLPPLCRGIDNSFFLNELIIYTLLSTIALMMSRIDKCFRQRRYVKFRLNMIYIKNYHQCNVILV